MTSESIQEDLEVQAVYFSMSALSIVESKADVFPCLVMRYSGPYRFQEELLETLDQANALGTFFVNGKNCELDFSIPAALL